LREDNAREGLLNDNDMMDEKMSERKFLENCEILGLDPTERDQVAARNSILFIEAARNRKI